METYIQSTGKTQVYNDGDLVSSGWNMTYDGDNLDIGTYSNGDETYVQLDNNEIMQLLSQPASKQSLEHRLLHDFPHKSHKKSTRKHKPKHKKKHKTKSVHKHKPKKTKKSKKSKTNPRIKLLADIEKTI